MPWARMHRQVFKIIIKIFENIFTNQKEPAISTVLMGVFTDVYQGFFYQDNHLNAFWHEITYPDIIIHSYILIT